MIVAGEFGWFLAVGVAAQLVDRALGTRHAVTLSAFLATLTLNTVLWLQLGRPAYEAPSALLLGAIAGVPLAAFLTRRLPRRAAVVGIGLGALALATVGLRHSLT
jgi:uncharacterized membrane protein YfcA